MCMTQITALWQEFSTSFDLTVLKSILSAAKEPYRLKSYFRANAPKIFASIRVGSRSKGFGCCFDFGSLIANCQLLSALQKILTTSKCIEYIYTIQNRPPIRSRKFPESVRQGVLMDSGNK